MKKYLKDHLDSLVKMNKKTISRLKKFKDKNKSQENIWVALPSPYDDLKLWESLGLKKNDFKMFKPWGKMHERGVLTASRIYRDDKNNKDENGTPRGHDYFSYIARNFSTAEEMFEFMETKGIHEGGHGSADWILAQLLEIDVPFRENIAVGLSRDGQDKKTTIYNNTYLLLEAEGEIRSMIKNVLFWLELNNIPQTEFKNLIEDGEYEKIAKKIKNVPESTYKALETKLTHDLSYNVGTRVLNLLLENISSKTGAKIDDDSTWIELITNMLKTGAKVQKETFIKNGWVITESERTALFFNKLIEQVTGEHPGEFFAKRGSMWL